VAGDGLPGNSAGIIDRWDAEKLAVEAEGLAQNKRVQATGEAARKNGKISAKVDVSSDFKHIPTIKANGVADKKSVSIVADVDNQRKVSLNGALNWKSYYDFDGSVDAKTAWTPRYAATVRSKRTAETGSYELVAKEDAKEVLAVKLSGAKKRQGWTAQGSVAAFGAELGRISAERDLSGAEESFLANVRSTKIDPIKVTYRLARSGKEIKPTVEVCRMGRRTQCATLTGAYRVDETRFSNKLDRALNVVGAFEGHELRVDFALNTKSAMVSKLFLTYDGQRVGYDVEKIESAGKKHIRAVFVLPQRTVQLKAALEQPAARSFRFEGELMADAIRDPSDKLTFLVNHSEQSSRRSGSAGTEIAISHPSWQRPLALSTFLEGGDKTKAKLMLDVQVSP
jgi:hypothetical protein